MNFSSLMKTTPGFRLVPLLSMNCFNQVSKQALYASLQQPNDKELNVTKTVHLMDFNGFYVTVCSGLILDIALKQRTHGVVLCI